jgi:hypothetical protein
MPVFEGHPNNAKSKIQNAKTTVKQKLNSKLQEEFMLLGTELISCDQSQKPAQSILPQELQGTISNMVA